MGTRLSPFMFQQLHQSHTPLQASNKRKTCDSPSSNTQITQKRRISHPSALTSSISQHRNNFIPTISTEGKYSEDNENLSNDPNFDDFGDDVGSVYSFDSSDSTVTTSNETQTTSNSSTDTTNTDHVPTVTTFTQGTSKSTKRPSMTLEDRFHRLFLTA